MDDLASRSLELHRKHRGKMELHPTVPLQTRDDLSLAYTPGVGQVSVEIGKDSKLAREYTIKRNTVAIVSDGSAILGLGNLGAHAAIPVMEGKAVLMKQFANVDAFPICLDTQDVDEIVATVQRIAPVFGAINLEDISAPRCFQVERKLRELLDIPVFHDDQHGTAVVVLAALINVLKVRGQEPGEVSVVISGAGAAGTAVAELLLAGGFTNLVACDSHGALYQGRAGMNSDKAALAAATNRRGIEGSLAGAMVGADIFVGVSAGGLVTQEMVRSMNPGPAILAMANPVPEIMPDDARAAGAAIVGTGRSDYPNQINNALAFPGIFRGLLDSGVVQVTDAMLLAAAQNLAAVVQAPSAEEIIPSIFNPAVVPAVASAFAAKL
jgi:malate dehydrogenase (oxaloacetate-decarboxylating)